MSLKHFHVVFIALAILCSLGFAAWALLVPAPQAGIRSLGWFSGVLGVGLAIYGVWFLRKARRIIT